MRKQQIIINLLLLTSLHIDGLFASDYTGYSSDSDESNKHQTTVYENGFHHGINCIEREFKLYGKSGDTIKFKKYMVMMSISSLSRESILIYKNYAYEEGLVPISIEYEKLVFKSFDREADAKYLADEILNKKYMGGRKKVIVKRNNPNQTYKRGKFIYSEIFDRMREEMEREVQGKVFITNGAYLSTPTTLSYTSPSSYVEETIPIATTTSIENYNEIPTYVDNSTYMDNATIEVVPQVEVVKKKKPIKKSTKSVKRKHHFTINDSKAEMFKYNRHNKLVSAGFINAGSEYSYQRTQTIEGVSYLMYKRNRFIELDDVTRY